MPKISQLPPTATPTTADLAVIVKNGITDYVLMSDLIALIFANATGANSPVTRWDESFIDYVASGGVWTADSAGVNRNASMSAMVVYINGRRISITAVSARTFTASKDTYVDVLDNADGTGTLVYTEASNNAASPALAANSIRIAIVVTGATTIANSGSINQGQPTAVLPIASSIAYICTDSLGNLICSRDPSNNVVGYHELVTGQSGFGAIADITGMSMVVKTPANCYKLKLSAEATVSDGTAGVTVTLAVTDSSNNIQAERATIIVASNINALQSISVNREIVVTPSTTYTFKLRLAGGATTVNQGNGAGKPSVLCAERVS